MQLVLPEQALPAKVVLNPRLRIMDDDEYWDFCAANPDVRFERTAQGEIVIVPPVYRAARGEPEKKRREPEKKTGLERLFGKGPIAGFVLDLTDIWEGL
jgi:hypothetical protein